MNSQAPRATSLTRIGVRVIAAGLLSWIVYGLAYAANVPTFADPLCEVYCGPFDVLSASVLLFSLSALVLATCVFAALTVRGSRLDRIAGVAAAGLAAVPVGIFSWTTFV